LIRGHDRDEYGLHACELYLQLDESQLVLKKQQRSHHYEQQLSWPLLNGCECVHDAHDDHDDRHCYDDGRDHHYELKLLTTPEWWSYLLDECADEELLLIPHDADDFALLPLH
jgi:hypothetical protein